MKASPSLPSLIQRALGPRGYAQQSRARLLLSGSAMSVMGGLLGGTAPLRGRASLEMIIRPFGYRDAAEFWGIDDPRLALLVHSIVGGTPAYRREFVAGDSPASLADFDSWVLRTVLNPQLPLFREARYLLAERGDTAGAWRNSQPTFLAQVAGPHFETICRDWAQSGADAFGEAPGEVAAGVVADPLRRGQIQIDAAVFAPDDPGRPRRVLSLGEAKWDKVMTLGHLERLRRARDLLAVKGYDTTATRLTCYNAAGFDPELSDAARNDVGVQLIGLDALYGRH